MSLLSATDEPGSSSITTSNTTCPHCTACLIFPNGAKLIQCPTCLNISSPLHSQPSFHNCNSCHAVLAHPSTVSVIECPLCGTKMDVGSAADNHNGNNDAAAGSDKPRKKEKKKRKRASSTNGSSGSSSEEHTGPVKKKPRKRRDPNAPKKPMGGYICFSSHQWTQPAFRAQCKGNIKDAASVLGAMWRALTDSERADWKVRSKDADAAAAAAVAAKSSLPLSPSSHPADTVVIQDLVANDAENHKTKIKKREDLHRYKQSAIALLKSGLSVGDVLKRVDLTSCQVRALKAHVTMGTY